MPDRQDIVELCADESFGVRTNTTHAGIMADRRLDVYLVNVVIEKLARLYGFSNFDHMNRFLTPTTQVAETNYVGPKKRHYER